MTSRLLGLLLIALLSHGNGMSVLIAADRIIDPVVLEELRTTAVDAWQAAEREFPSSLDVTIRFTNREGDPKDLKTTVLTYRLVHDKERDCVLFRTQNEEWPDAMDHEVTNARYLFRVSADDMAARGVLSQLKLQSELTDPRERRFSKAEYHWELLSGKCVISLPELLKPLEFEPIEAVVVDDSPEGLLRYSAKYLGGKAHHRIRNATYTMVVDPKHDYRWVSGTINRPSESREFSAVYHEDDTIPTPREITILIKEGLNYHVHQKFEIELPQPCTLADEEFYLPHYGFSEQVIETLHPNPWPRWLLIGFGVFTIALGAWLIRDKRDRAA